MSWEPLDPKKPVPSEVLGDEPFDAISNCFREVTAMYFRDWQRKPSLRELVGTVRAVLMAQIADHTSDGETAELTELNFKTRKIAKRQKYAVGDVLVAQAANGKPVYARIFEIHDGIGPLVGVYDSLGMPKSDLDAIIRRPLAVKVFPIHHELLEKRIWLVIGNRPVTANDQKQPRGPLQIAGRNQQLEAANFFYGLGPASFHNIRDCAMKRATGG